MGRPGRSAHSTHRKKKGGSPVNRDDESGRMSTTRSPKPLIGPSEVPETAMGRRRAAIANFPSAARGMRPNRHARLCEAGRGAGECPIAACSETPRPSSSRGDVSRAPRRQFHWSLADRVVTQSNDAMSDRRPGHDNYRPRGRKTPAHQRQSTRPVVERPLPTALHIASGLALSPAAAGLKISMRASRSGEALDSIFQIAVPICRMRLL